MPHALYLTCPPIKFGKPKLGETRTLPSGILEYKEAIIGDWKPAVRLNDVRGTLIANAAAQGVYTHDRGAGKEVHNLTAYLPADKDFGGDFDHRPPALKQIERKADQQKKKPKGVKTYLGRVLLDPYDHPIRNFPELPATLSTEMKGWEVEHHLRKNLAIKPYDLMALCMSNYTDGKGKPHAGPPRIASLTEKATKFRRKAGLPSLKIKPGSDNIINYIKSLLPQGADTLEELEGDLDPEEMKASRALNARRYPNRRRKVKREEEARAREEQISQLDDQEGHQSTEIDLALIPAVTGDTSANADVSAPSVNGKINKARGLKRRLSEVSPKAYSEDEPRPSKIQMCATAARDTEVPPRRRIRKSRNTNTVFKQPQQTAEDPPQVSLKVDTLQSGFQENEANFDESDPWSTLALDAEEMATQTSARRSNVMEPKPWHATRASGGTLYSSLADDMNASKSYPGHVGELRHPNNIYYHPTAQYTSHSNLPAHPMIIRESSEWMYDSNTSFTIPNTTAAPRISLDHAMTSAYPHTSPACYQYPCKSTYRHSERVRGSDSTNYNASLSNKSTYTSPTNDQPTINAAHSTTSETVFPDATALAVGGDKPNYIRDKQSQNGSCRPAIDDTMDFSSPNQEESDMLGILTSVTDGNSF